VPPEARSADRMPEMTDTAEGTTCGFGMAADLSWFRFGGAVEGFAPRGFASPAVAPLRPGPASVNVAFTTVRHSTAGRNSVMTPAGSAARRATSRPVAAGSAIRLLLLRSAAPRRRAGRRAASRARSTGADACVIAAEASDTGLANSMALTVGSMRCPTPPSRAPLLRVRVLAVLQEGVAQASSTRPAVLNTGPDIASVKLRP
jgi:hypothetical protein